jgi:hypothetical protein
MITHCTIYGERCSGTNYLENLILKNFDVKITWKYGWKHFFGFNDLHNSKQTLFICIVREIHSWMNSFFREKHHLKIKNQKKLSKEEKKKIFLNDQFYSVIENEDEIMKDRNMYTKKRYKNIFELRHTKIKWMLEDLPHKVDNYIFIRYEDLLNNFEKTMTKIKNIGLKIKDPKKFPENVYTYKKEKYKKYRIKHENFITKKEILNHPSFKKYYEKRLNYL